MNENMKIMTRWLISFMVAIHLLSGCEADTTTYLGPSFVQFSDSSLVLPIMNSEQIHEIYLSSSKAVNYERNFGVEVLVKESNAVEGYHFSIENHTVNIKSGEQVGVLKIRGHYENMTKNDSLAITLNIVNPDDEQSLYEHKTHVLLSKVCAFNLDDFIGPCVVESQFFREYTLIDIRLIESVKDPEHDNGMILKNYFQDGYDLKIRFNPKDPLEPTIEMDNNQIIAKASEFFNHIYQDDKLRADLADNYESIFNACEKSLVQYSKLYIENEGIVGVFRSNIYRITEAEADYLRKQGY